MNSTKKFAEMILDRLKKPLLKSAGWLKELNSVKIIALIVVNCFLLTGVYGQAVAAVAENVRSAQQFKQIFEDFTLPYSYGKITSANFAGSDTVVVNIQDLHSHPEVQKNISKIIDTFDKKYGVKQVYLEGAYGDVDTSWLSSISDKDVKEKIMGALIDSGRLTGAEYYSATSGRTNVIKGLEDKKEYLENLQRFGKILEDQDQITPILDSMSEDINRLKGIYYNRHQRKIEELSKDYSAGKIEGKKYFALLYKYTDALGIDVYKYENIDTYKTLLATERTLDYKKVSAELQLLVLKLKELLPYQAYKLIVDNTANFSEVDKLYIYLIKFSREYKIDLEVNFPNLNRFLGYVELSQKINPLELIAEEKKLTDEINEKFSTNPTERNIVFLVSFQKYLKDFLSSKISSDDYAYYEANKDQFRNMWIKYIDNKKITLLDSYINLAEDFYRVNIARNKYFFDNVDLNSVSKLPDANAIAGDSTDQVIKSLKEAKNVYVIVTGGFHTQGVSEYLSQKGISAITITPQVTGGVQLAEETYYRIAKEQSKMLFNALATLITSLLPTADQKAVVADSLIKELREVKSKVQSGDIKVGNLDAANDLLKGFGEKSKDKFTAEITEINNGTDDKDFQLNVQIDGKTSLFDYNKSDRAFVPKNDKADNANADSSRKMSVRSRNPIIIASSIAVALTAVTAFFAVAMPFAIPFVALISGYVVSSGFLVFSLYERSKMSAGAVKARAAALATENKLAEKSMQEIGEAKANYRLLQKFLERLPEDLQIWLITRMLKSVSGLTPEELEKKVADIRLKIRRTAEILSQIEEINSKKPDIEKALTRLRKLQNSSGKLNSKDIKTLSVLLNTNKDYIKNSSIDELIVRLNQIDVNELKKLNTASDFLAKELLNSLSSSIPDSTIAMSFGSEEPTPEFKSEAGLVHLNYNLLSKVFFDGANVKNTALLETFVRHERRHAAFADAAKTKAAMDKAKEEGTLEQYKEANNLNWYKSLGISFKASVHKRAWLEELIVSLGDLSSFIGISVRNFFKRSSTTQFSGQKDKADQISKALEELRQIKEETRPDVLKAFEDLDVIYAKLTALKVAFGDNIPREEKKENGETIYVFDENDGNRTELSLENKSWVKRVYDTENKEIENKRLYLSGFDVDGNQATQTQIQVDGSYMGSDLGYITRLGTSGGKTNMGDLISLKLLVRSFMDGKGAKMFYSTAKDNLIAKDMFQRAEFMNKPEVINFLTEIGFPLKEIRKTADSAETIKGFQIAIYSQGSEYPTLFAADGTTYVDKSIKKKDIQDAHIVAANYQSAVFDDQESHMSDTDSLSAGRIFFFDEAHTLLDQINQSFLRSGSEEKDRALLDDQIKILAFVHEELGSLSREELKKYIKIEGTRAVLNERGKGKFKLTKKLKEELKITGDMSESKFEAQVQNALSVLFTLPKDVKEGGYAVTIDGFVFKSGRDSVVIKIDHDQKNASTASAVINGQKVTLRIDKAIEDINIEDLKDISVKLELMKVGLPDTMSLDVLKFLQSLPKNATDKEIEEIQQKIQKRFPLSVDNIKKIKNVLNSISEPETNESGKGYKKTISTIGLYQEGGNISYSSKYGGGLHAMLELALEKGWAYGVGEKYDFAGQYSVDTRSEGEYPIIAWLKKAAGVVGTTGTPRENLMLSIFGDIFKGMH
ncbi:MAG: hypothetical protein FWC57_01195, partial [Endomicrobia bacterium]|nr:hypothetical protein [Endomicrobiia bacterium]